MHDRLLGAGLLVLLVLGLVQAPRDTNLPQQPGHGTGGDGALFRAVAMRVGAGEPYYPAMREELIARNYFTASVANWRTPLHLEILGHAPRALRGVTILLGFLVVIGTGAVLRATTRSWLLCAVGSVLQLGGVLALWVESANRGLSEPLTGGLIALSVIVSLGGWRTTGLLLGGAALFVRELAGLYVGVRWVHAVWRRDWREAGGWSLLLAVYGIYYGWHVTQVYHAMPSDPATQGSWLQLGGVPAVLNTLRTNTWLLLSPWWLLPVALVAAVLGAWGAPAIVGWPILAYLAAFALVGHPFNWYWGWIPGMLIPLAWAQVGTRAWARTGAPSDSGH